MNFDLTNTQKKLYAEVSAFAKEHFSEHLIYRDRESQFDRDGWNRIADFGLFEGFAPKEYGGKGWDVLTRSIALEAFGYGCRDNGLSLGVGIVAWPALTPILSMGNEAQKLEWVPKLVSGKVLPTNGITEPEAGSDAMSMTTSAERTDDGYVLNGKKCYIGFGPIADLIVLFARTSPELGAWGISAFLVETDRPGITKSPNREKMGLRTLPFGDLLFDDVYIPESAILGEEGAGLSLFNESMEWERCCILATQVGAMRRQLEECIAFSNERKQFGKRIGEFQSVSNRIAEMRVRLETCRLLLYQAAWLKDQGRSAALESSIAKLCISEAFFASSQDAVRIHGAQGFLTEFEVERDLRDSAGSIIYAGTSDIQRNVISQLSGL